MNPMDSADPRHALVVHLYQYLVQNGCNASANALLEETRTAVDENLPLDQYLTEWWYLLWTLSAAERASPANQPQDPQPFLKPQTLPAVLRSQQQRPQPSRKPKPAPPPVHRHSEPQPRQEPTFPPQVLPLQHKINSARFEQTVDNKSHKPSVDEALSFEDMFMF